MRGEPYTPCNISPYRYPATVDPQPQEGAFLVSAAGSAYRIEHAHELPTNLETMERRYKLRCTRWPLAEVPDDAMRFDIVWDKRG